MSDGQKLVERTERGLLDTSTVVHFGRITATQYLPSEPLISTITLAELSVGPLLALTQKERAVRQARLQLTEARFKPIPFEVTAARVFGRVSAELRAGGRKPEARRFDALIAAVAIANGLPLHTCNPKAFTGISELKLVAIPYPDKN